MSGAAGRVAGDHTQQRFEASSTPSVGALRNGYAPMALSAAGIGAKAYLANNVGPAFSELRANLSHVTTKTLGSSVHERISAQPIREAKDVGDAILSHVTGIARDFGLGHVDRTVHNIRVAAERTAQGGTYEVVVAASLGAERGGGHVTDPIREETVIVKKIFDYVGQKREICAHREAVVNAHLASAVVGVAVAGSEDVANRR